MNAILRDKLGRILPGQAALNPGGRPRMQKHVRDLIQENGEKAVLRFAALISDDALNTEANQALFESLRDLRRRLAEEQELPPYVIFHDKTLAAMVVHKPLSEEQFLALSGVGAAKLERYGEAFMKLIRQAETGSVEADLQQ